MNSKDFCLRLKLERKHSRMRAFSYAWSLPVTWQSWWSRHSICHNRKPQSTCKLHGSMFYRTAVIADRSFTLREWRFWTIFTPVTLTLIRWPSYTNLTRIPWRYTGYVKMNFLYIKGFTALHGMQTRSNDENSVCLSLRPSVSPSNAWIVTKRKRNMSRFLYHTKDHLA